MSASKEKCSHGHAMTPENTAASSTGQTICRACMAMYTRNYRARRRAMAAAGEAIPTRPRLSTRDRLMPQINVLPNGCWEWTGFVNKQGYGRTSYKGRRSVPAQQAFYDLLVGPIPEGTVLDHRCHTDDKGCPGGPTCPHRRCVNPDHLEPVTGEENSSRGATGRRTHCPKGHPYDDENTLVSNGRRYCRTCQRAHSEIQTAKAAAKKAAAA